MTPLQWFDNRTILLCQLLVTLLMVPALLQLRRMNPHMRGIGHMAAAYLLGIPGLLLISLRGNVSSLLSILGGNCLVILTYYLTYRGLQLFLGDRSRYWFALETSTVVGILVLAYYTWVTPDIVPRSLVAAWSIALACLLSSLVLWKHSGGRRLLRYGALFFASGTVVGLHRMTVLLLHGMPQDYMQRSALQTTGLLIGFVFVVITGMFLLALIATRMRSEALHAAQVDTLTGALTRAAAEHRFATELAAARQTGRPLSLLLIDIDHFKLFNDTVGHAAGDAALRSVAGAIREQLRSYDTFGRFGGDELMVLLPSTAAEDSLLVAERIRKAVASLPPVHASLPLTVSIGGTQNAAADSEKTLLSRADSALYLVKKDRRNGVRFLSSDASKNNTGIGG